MPRNTKVDCKKKLCKDRKHQSRSQQRQTSRSLSPKLPDKRRKRTQSPNENRNDSPTSFKNDPKYRRFVRGLKRDIRHQLNHCLRENGFDPSGKKPIQYDPVFRSKRAVSALDVDRPIDTTKCNPSAINRQHCKSDFSKETERRRLQNDIRAILTGSEFKNFYFHFVNQGQRQTKSAQATYEIEESFLLSYRHE